MLTNAELDALLAKPESVLIIDVRRPDEISKIGGFPVYLNIQPADIAANAKSIPRDRSIVTVSNHAARAGRTADQLKDLGIQGRGRRRRADLRGTGRQAQAHRPAGPEGRHLTSVTPLR